MLKQNTTILCQYPLRQIGGLFAGERTMWDQTERRNKFISEAGWDATAGQPNGHLHPSSWNLPQKAGGMSAYTSVSGSGAVSSDMALGLSALADLTGSGDITDATAQLVISMVASLTGVGTIADADFKAYLNGVANLTGSGSVTAAIGALAWADAALSAGGDITNATPYASGELAATIRGYSDLTPEGIRDQVWNAILANYPGAGSAGLALSTASSGGVDLNALAASVLAAAEITPIHSRVKIINDTELAGAGTPADPMRPA